MADGSFKNIKDIIIGEYVLGVDNQLKKVSKKFHEFEDIYLVTPKRGKSYKVSGSHLLYLINRDSKVNKNSNTRLTKVEDWNSLTDYRKANYVGMRNFKILEFQNDVQEPSIDPYFIGLWIGDGIRSNNSIIVNKTRDPEIYDYLIELDKKNNYGLVVRRKELKRYKVEMYMFCFPISRKYGENGEITSQFVNYNLYYNKHIPNGILYGSVKTRREFLAGLIDTDGYYSPEGGKLIITSKSENLIKQIQQLARSLGAICSLRKVDSQSHIYQGVEIKYTETNELKCIFYDNSIIPTKVKRKQGNRISIKNIHTSPIESVENLGPGEYFGIECEGHLYFLEDLTIAHDCSFNFLLGSGDCSHTS